MLHLIKTLTNDYDAGGMARAPRGLCPRRAKRGNTIWMHSDCPVVIIFKQAQLRICKSLYRLLKSIDNDRQTSVIHDCIIFL